MVGPKTKAPTGALASLFKGLNMMSAENGGQTGGLTVSHGSASPWTLQRISRNSTRKVPACTPDLAANKRANFLEKISPELNRYGKVVFATHGYFDKDLPGIMEPVYWF